MTNSGDPQIRVEWDSPAQRWLIITYQARWRWEDIDQHKQTVDAMLNTVNYEVGAIGDLRAAASFVIPNAVPNITKAFATAPSHVGFIVVVGANRFFRVVVLLVRRILPNSPLRNLVFVESLSEAQTLMEARYPTAEIVPD